MKLANYVPTLECFNIAQILIDINFLLYTHFVHKLSSNKMKEFKINRLLVRFWILIGQSFLTLLPYGFAGT